MKRILAIDGGGIKGVFPASFLATVEEIIGDRVARYFDLIAGTSTGGIIALGLGLGLTAREVLDLYEDIGPRVFSTSRGVWAHVPRWARQWFRARYDTCVLRAALSARMEGQRLGDSSVRLVIPSFNLETGQPHIYMTAHAPMLMVDYRCDAIDVALATSAAPTFFPAHLTIDHIPLIDGGVMANNPVGIAVVEAISLLAWRPEELHILSLGCTSVPFDARSLTKASAGKLQWATKMVDVFMKAQSEIALGTAYMIASHDRVWRVSPTAPGGRFELDAHEEIASLRGLGVVEARHRIPHLRPVFFSEPVESFRPIHQLPG